MMTAIYPDGKSQGIGATDTGVNQKSHEEWPLQPTKSVMISRGGSSSKG